MSQVDEVLDAGPHAGELIGEKLRRMVDEEAARAEREPEPEPPALPPRDPHARPCSVCGGWGILQTGSLVEAHDVRQCWHCGGVGFEEAIQVAPQAAERDPADTDDVEYVASPVAGAWVWPQAGR